MSGVYYITVSEDEDGQRLDRFLQKHLKGTPIGLLQKLMRKGQIRVDSKRVKTNTRISEGQSVRIPPLEKKENAKNKISEQDAEFIRSLVIYDKDGVVAINKPSGIATQGGTNINRHIDGFGVIQTAYSIVSHNNRNRIYSRTLGFRGCPVKYTSGTNTCSNRSTCTQSKGECIDRNITVNSHSCEIQQG